MNIRQAALESTKAAVRRLSIKCAQESNIPSAPKTSEKSKKKTSGRVFPELKYVYRLSLDTFKPRLHEQFLCGNCPCGNFYVIFIFDVTIYYIDVICRTQSLIFAIQHCGFHEYSLQPRSRSTHLQEKSPGNEVVQPVDWLIDYLISMELSLSLITRTFKMQLTPKCFLKLI